LDFKTTQNFSINNPRSKPGIYGLKILRTILSPILKKDRCFESQELILSITAKFQSSGWHFEVFHRGELIKPVWHLQLFQGYS
jgi:hypothetical protein